MDIGAAQIVGVVASGTTSYLVSYAPVFLFVSGLVLALGVGAWLVSVFTGKKIDVFDDDRV
jgi:hypothetical protein